MHDTLGDLRQIASQSQNINIRGTDVEPEVGDSFLRRQFTDYDSLTGSTGGGSHGDLIGLEPLISMLEADEKFDLELSEDREQTEDNTVEKVGKEE